MYSQSPSVVRGGLFSLVLARSFPSAILLTGHAQLRFVSTKAYKLKFKVCFSKLTARFEKIDQPRPVGGVADKARPPTSLI